MTNNNDYQIDTLAIHAGTQPDPTTGAIATPIYQTTAFAFRDTQHAANLFKLKEPGHIYTRLSNPTVSALADRLVALEGGLSGVCASCGLNAHLVAFINLLSAGDNFIAGDKLYGGSGGQFSNTFKQFGWEARFFDASDPENIRKLIDDKTKFVFVEALTNPTGGINDIEAIAKVAHEEGLPLIVDNTLASPYLLRPIEWGADIVVCSTTKFINGNGTAVGGAVIDSGNFNWGEHRNKYPQLCLPDASYSNLCFYDEFKEQAFTVRAVGIGLRDLGGCMAPQTAFLTLNNLETLPLRVQRHSDNAQKVAEFLYNHPKVAWCSYVGLKNSSYQPLVKKYLPKGCGSIFTFGVKGGVEDGRKVVESLDLVTHTTNLGDVKTLILHSATTTHSRLTPEQQIAAGVRPETLRISIGIENVDDIIADLDQALSKI